MLRLTKSEIDLIKSFLGNEGERFFDLSKVFIKIKGKICTLFGTDGKRLIKIEREFTRDIAEGNYIISIDDILSLYKQYKDKTTAHINMDMLIARCIIPKPDSAMLDGDKYIPGIEREVTFSEVPIIVIDNDYGVAMNIDTKEKDFVYGINFKFIFDVVKFCNKEKQDLYFFMEDKKINEPLVTKCSENGITIVIMPYKLSINKKSGFWNA